MKKNKSTTATRKDIDWHTLTGDIPFRMTNDYLFRALMQNDNDEMGGIAYVSREKSGYRQSCNHYVFP